MDSLAPAAQRPSSKQNTLPSDRSRSISLILPAYNEEDVIRGAVAEAIAALETVAEEFEVLVVNDGSKDATAQIVQQIAASDPRVRLLDQPKNMGYGAALRRGFAESTKEYVSFTDADCQFDLRELDRLMFLAKNYDIVTGYRMDRQDHWIRNVYSGGYNAIVRNLLGVKVRDIDCALKVFRREVVQSLTLHSNGFFINSEVFSEAKRAGYSIIEVGVTHRSRAAGESKVSPLQILPVGTSILRYWWNRLMFPSGASAKTNATNDNSPSFFKSYWATAVLAIMAIIVLGTNAGYPLIEPDEVRYAQIAMEMADSGDYITPRLLGEPYLDKPPLLYWLSAASISCFGQGEFSFRLPSILAAFCTVMGLFLIGRQTVSARAAWIGAFGLLTCGGFVLAGRYILTDMLLTCFVTLGLMFAFLYLTNQRSLNWKLATLCCAAAVLAKGPVAFLLMVPPVLIFGWLTQCRLPSMKAWIASAAFVVLLCSPWYALVISQNAEFSYHFFWKHNIERFASGSNHTQPFWFYLPVVVAGMFPLSMLVPWAAAFLASRKDEVGYHRNPAIGFGLLTSVWILSFFSISSCKLPTYILPAIPPLCLLIGSAIDYFMMLNRDANQTNAFPAIPQRGTLTLLLLLVPVCLIVAFVDRGINLWFHATICAIALAAVGSILKWKTPKFQLAPGWIASAAVVIVFTLFTWSSLVPTLASQRSIQAAASRVWAQNKEQPVIFFDHTTMASQLYLPSAEIHSLAIGQEAELLQLLQSHPQAILVASRRASNLLPELLEGVSKIRERLGRDYVFACDNEMSANRTANLGVEPTIQR